MYTVHNYYISFSSIQIFIGFFYFFKIFAIPLEKMIFLNPKSLTNEDKKVLFISPDGILIKFLLIFGVRQVTRHQRQMPNI